MAHVRASDRLTAEDAAFLYLENEETPLHIGSVSIFEGEIPLEGLTEYVESRLPSIPRYRQRLVMPPLNIGHPTWEADPNFDIRNHVHYQKLKRGTEGELRALAGKIFSRIMDRTKPVWDLTLVGGLHGRRCGLISRVHHCLVDGVSGVGLMNVMLNADGQMPPAQKKGKYHAPPLPGAEESMLDALASLVGAGGPDSGYAIRGVEHRSGADQRPGAARVGSIDAVGAGASDAGGAATF